ncbi:MAG TPA: multidrug ABC transporter substrate-binding protein [Rhodospirillaceae bacterium]|nr:multidrug ABC transporter substrate-binding protein [Candidatus Neomarinimicrobiota bacterium]HCX14248.1 multidrug ABC transporter substrate-binding protein [Rhodospirillaceae bacterium]
MIGNTLIMAFNEIKRNILRSSLTVLGIIIGVAAVIIIVTLGSGTTAQVGSEISKMGSNMLTLMPGGNRRMGGAAVSSPLFKISDVEALRREVPNIAAIAPYAQRMAHVIAGNENRRSNVVGTTGEFTIVRNWNLTSGRTFTLAEEQSGKSVCIIGSTIQADMFPGQDPIGAAVRVGKISCEVIGVLEAKGQVMFGGDQDLVVVLPIRTYQRRIAGSDRIPQIFISAFTPEGLSSLKVEVTDLMRERRRLGEGEDSNFDILDMTEVSEVMESTIGTMTTFLSAIAAVSLLVGGIGIMNIMLVSVTERTREIGIRLAIGATEQEVMMQFLIEAALLSALGGFVGIVIGLIGAAAVAPAIDVPFVFEPLIVFMAFAFSAIVGVAFGFMPARRAARLNPIEALRHE